MASSCTHCSTPLIGSSCYVCGWSPQASGTTTEDTHCEESVWQPPQIADGPQSLVADPSDDYYMTQPLDGELLPPPTAPPLPVPEDPPGDCVTDSANDSAGIASGIGAALSHAVTGDTIVGTIAHVSEVSLETANLTAFNASQQLTTGCLMAPFKALAIVLGILVAPLRFLLMAGIARPGRPNGPDDIQVQVHRFRLQDQDTGQLVECVLRGDLTGGGIYLGEDVEVTGRFDRKTGTFQVNRIVNQSTGAATTGTLDRRVKHQKLALFASLYLALVAIWFLWSLLS